MAEYKLLASPLRRFSTHEPARLSGGEGNSVSRFGSAGVTSRRHQLAEDLGGNLRSALAKLVHRRRQRAPERGWHGEAGEPLLQGLHPPAMGPFLRRRIEK
jgi:hypothetical protein